MPFIIKDNHQSRGAVFFFGATLAFVLFYSPYLISLLEVDDFGFTRWSERDFYRSTSENLFLQYTGAELSHGNGFRLPGNLNYFLNWVLMGGRDNPEILHKTTIILYLICCWLLFLALSNITNIYCGLLGASFFVFNSSNFYVIFQIWNPALFPHLGTIFTICVLGYIKTKNEYLFLLAFSTALVMLNLHLTGLFLLIPFLIFTHFFIKKFSAGKFISCIVLTLVVFSPYVIGEFSSGGQNTKLLLNQWLVSRPSDLLHTSSYYVIQKLIRFFSQVVSPVDIILYDFSWPWLAMIFIYICLFVIFIIECIWQIFKHHKLSKTQVSREHRLMLLFSTIVVGVQCLYLSSYTVLHHYVVSGTLFIPVIISLSIFYSQQIFGNSKRINATGVFKKYIVLCVAFVLNVPAIAQIDMHLEKNKTKLYNDQSAVISELSKITKAPLNHLPFNTIFIYDYQSPNGQTLFYPSTFDPSTYFTQSDYSRLSSPSEGPCFMVFRNVPRSHSIRGFSTLDFEDYISKIIFKARPTELSGIKIYEITPTNDDRNIVIKYQQPNRLCLSSANQRLILSDLEKKTMTNFDKIKNNRITQSRDDTNLFFFNLMNKVYGAILFENENDGIQMTFSANQLRGQAPTLHGFFQDSHISDLQIFAVTEKENKVLLFSRNGLIGKLAQHTPLIHKINSSEFNDVSSLILEGKILIDGAFIQFQISTENNVKVF